MSAAEDAGDSEELDLSNQDVCTKYREAGRIASLARELLDGALLVEARLVLTDSSLFFWELLQLLAALRAADAPPNSPAFHRELLLTGVAIGAAVATKWTALATMAVVGLESIRSLAVALGEGWHNFHHAYPHDYLVMACAIGMTRNEIDKFLKR